VALASSTLGKPADPAEARAMLSRLAGRTHEVHTAVALRHAGGAAARVSTSSVSLRALAPAEIDSYCRSGEPDDKAGGYAVQGRAAVFIRHIAGSYSGIMGLPLCETWELLAPVLGHAAGSAGP
jgi:nucleoside triphosphate pyrophosphatase